MRPIDPETGHHYGPSPDPITVRDVLLSIALFVNPHSSAIVRMAAQPKEKHMSQHRTAKRPFSRTTDGQQHPVVVRHVGTPAYYRDQENLDVDPHLWGAYGEQPLSSIVGTAMLTSNPEPQHVVVAAFDPMAPAMTERPETPRRAGIPVPTMEPASVHTSSHVDEIH